MNLNSVFLYLTRLFFSFFSRLNSWKIEGDFPNIAKFVAVIAPHNSLLDFWYMFNARILLNVDHYTLNERILPRNIYWLAKKSLFKWPLEYFIRKLGAIPVDRSRSNNIVNKLTEIALHRDTFVIGIAPDGTRRGHANTTDFNWKSGFYHLALKTNIPVVSCYIDYSRKTVFIDNPVYLKGIFETDMNIILRFYKAKIQ